MIGYLPVISTVALFIAAFFIRPTKPNPQRYEKR